MDGWFKHDSRLDAVCAGKPLFKHEQFGVFALGLLLHRGLGQRLARRPDALVAWHRVTITRPLTYSFPRNRPLVFFQGASNAESNCWYQSMRPTE
jgi:hypothetical protein